MRGVFSTPSPPRRSPPPINRGRAPSGLFSHSARGAHSYLLLTTYYLSSYFLSFFSPFAEKTLTIFNIHPTCFANYKGPASADNTNIFYKVTNNFSFSPNIFSDSPSNFTDFLAKNGIKIVEIPRFTEVSPLPYYKDNKFSSEMQIR